MVAKLPPLISRARLKIASRTNLASLKQIHAIAIAAGFSGDATTVRRIIRLAALSLPGDMEYASLLFHRFERPDSSLCNAMLQGYSLRSQYAAAVALFTGNYATPDEHTFPVLLKCLSNSGAASNPEQIHAQIFKLGLGTDLFIQNSLLSCYAKGGELNSARNLFGEMPHRDAISWNAMVLGHVKNHHPEQGLEYFIKMKSSGVEIDRVIIVSVFSGCAITGNIWLAASVQAFYIESGRVVRDVYIDSALVDMYGKCGFCADARKVFDEMPLRNVVSWSSLISVHVHCNRFKEALSIFSNMLECGPNPNQVTVTTTLAACAHLGALEHGRWVHRYMSRVGMQLNSITGTALINMYAKCGRIVDSLSVFRKLEGRDTYSWTAMINGLAMHGFASECHLLFSEMLHQSVQPNEVTFLGVLSACSHAGLVSECKLYFDRMVKVHGITPKLEHYGCVVDVLCRAGHLEEALVFVENMPVDPSAAIWGSLFGACMIRKDFVMGEKIGEHMIGVEPENGGGYVFLMNMYSGLQRWKEAAGMRMKMRQRKTEKAGGCSWLEVNGVTHEFLAGDGAHALSLDLCDVLDGMSTVMKLEAECSSSENQGPFDAMFLL
ncbi:Pentatricopeptide repeat-containing protein [Platanthera zijinensis]|uniref:Pentatricopeptide repeat-containing protein n=1 Tax=Platanthera zijinensis TaxID=2320716 RepID=A0AAP0BQ99_9ASPA